MHTFIRVLFACVPVLAASCGDSADAKAKAALDKYLTGTPPCEQIPVGMPLDMSKVGTDGALGILLSGGYIQPGKITIKSLFGKESVRDAYVLTEKGKPLSVREPYHDGFGEYKGACLRTGHFKVRAVEAIDNGNDATGRLIATVRVKLTFTPDEWIAPTKGNPAWSGFWKRASDAEASSWMYQLHRSGDEFYPLGKGQKVN